MGQSADAVESKKAGRAFDRMHGAEHGIDQIEFDIGPGGLDRQHLLLDIGQPLARFDYEIGD